MPHFPVNLVSCVLYGPTRYESNFEARTLRKFTRRTLLLGRYRQKVLGELSRSSWLGARPARCRTSGSSLRVSSTEKNAHETPDFEFSLYPPPPQHRRHTPPLHTTTAAAVTRHRFHRRHRHHHYHRLHTTAAATTTTMCFSVAALVICFSVSSFAFFFSIRCHSRSLSKFGVKGPIGNFKHMFSSARALKFISFAQRWSTPKSTGISLK